MTNVSNGLSSANSKFDREEDASVNYCDITVVITAHREGALAHRAMRGIRAAMEQARERGFSCEVVAVLDAADDETRAYFHDLDWDALRRFHTDFRDPGLARNLGVRQARGRFVAFIDADDLFGRHWLARAAELLVRQEGPAVAVPQKSVVFEGDWIETDHYGSDHPYFSVNSFLERNYWNSLLMVSRAVALRYPFRETPAESGFGYEDWHWYCNILSDQIPVLTVEEGCVFVRRKHRHSRLMAHVAHDTLLAPTPLLHPARMAASSATAAETPRPASRAARGNLSARQMGEGMVDRVCGLIYRVGQDLVRRLPFLMALALPIYRRIRQLEDRLTGRGRMPQWLAEEWNAIRAIEPQLAPRRHMRHVDKSDWQAASPLADAYRQLCEKAGGRFTHILLVPWLKRGGADLEVLNYVEAILGEEMAEGVLVLGTEETDSPWAERLPAGARFVNFGEVAARLCPEEQERLLATFLVQAQAPVVHNLNSRLGYAAFRRFGPALSRVTKLYASVFCEDYDEQGRAVGYPLVELPRCVEYLTAVMADNQRILDRLQEVFAIPRDKLLVHYQPVPIREKAGRERAAKDQLQVVWAARLDRQKRPDLLIEIARACQHLPIHFHVHGSVLLECQGRWSFRSLPNVTHHGPFNGFESLPVEDYDVFLNNSQWEGLPNALIEALSCGLPVVSSDVGGIGELVRHEETGLLVEPFDDVDQYVAALERLHRDPPLARRLADEGRQLVAERHSWDAFVEAVRAVPGYLEAPTKIVAKQSA